MLPVTPFSIVGSGQSMRYGASLLVASIAVLLSRNVLM
jgi:hypothetical protein